MPKYFCDECERGFSSKERLEEHVEGHSGGERREIPDIGVGAKDFIKNMSRKQLLILFGVFLMATLFVGPVVFYSSLFPGSTSLSSPGNTGDTNPPTGFNIRRASQVPEVSESELPGSFVSENELSRAAQVNLLVSGGPGNRPAVLMQYNCECPELRRNMTAFASDFNGWVYVAPYSDMDTRIALTAYRRSLKLDSFDRGQAFNFICNNLRSAPIYCTVGMQ